MPQRSELSYKNHSFCGNTQRIMRNAVSVKSVMRLISFIFYRVAKRFQE